MSEAGIVGDLLSQLEMTLDLRQRVLGRLGARRAAPLLQELESLQLKPSRALTRLGSYVSRGSTAHAIHLQFAQEPEQLRQTLLHEIAHFFDHQTRFRKGAYRNPHGQSWQQWLELLGGQHLRASSAQLEELYRQRLKPVARCERCGFVLERLRRLACGRRWVHRSCGGRLRPL